MVITINRKSLGPPPPPSSKHVTKVMKANVGKNTKPEAMIRKLLRESDMRGYKLNWKKIPGSPDIVYSKQRIAIFINGCFWHRCPYCKPSLPKLHRSFWKKKFELNKVRDKEKTTKLKKLGWRVFVFWECQIKKNAYKLASRIKKYEQRKAL